MPSNTFHADLVSLLSAMPVMPKDTTNPFFKSKYTSLDKITETVTPILAKHNFAWTTQPSFNESDPTLKYALVHASGEKLEGEMKLLLKSNDPQGQGSAISYARRYAITSVLNIVSDEDDDGNAAKKAAEAAKTIDPPSPEEPSVNVEHLAEVEAAKADPNNVRLKKMFAERGFTDTKAKIAFNKNKIGKSMPETEGQYKVIFAALEVIPPLEETMDAATV